MKEGIQTNFPNKEIQEYGCYFLDILRWAEVLTRKWFDETAILNLFEKAKEQGIIGAECYVNNAAALFNLAAGASVYKSVTKTDKPPLNGTYIICNKKPMYTHFTLWDGERVWDSLSPQRAGAAAYKPDSYRLLT